MADEIEVDVAIIGNGPSALALSVALNGAIPHIENSAAVPNSPLQKAVKGIGAATPLDEVNLADWTHGISRRCVNPTAALVDALRYPDGDGLGTSVLAYGKPKEAVTHVVIGAGYPGGSWHAMSPSTVSLSPGSWMDLPGPYSLKAHLRSSAASHQARALAAHVGSPEQLVDTRVPRWLVAEYYRSYSSMLPPGVLRSGKVTELTEPEDSGKHGDANSSMWTLQVEPTKAGEMPCPRTVRARAVVLAGGIYDAPRKLGIPGEDLPFVSYRVPAFTNADAPKSSVEHLLIVGAGLSAADAVITALDEGSQKAIHVTHVFRGAADSTKVGRMFGLASFGVYAPEGQLVRLMAGKERSSRYTPYAHSELTEIREGGTCVVAASGKTPVEVQGVTSVIVLIGGLPSLGFLPERVAAELAPSPHAKRLRTDGQPSSHPCFVTVRPDTMEVVSSNSTDVENAVPLAAGLFAIGPLRGDNFVRFILGDALAVRHRLLEGDGVLTKSCLSEPEPIQW